MSNDVYTRSQLADQLRELGIKQGDKVLAHTSLRSVGRIDGSGSALVQAYLDVLKPSGLLVAPTFTYHVNEFDPAATAGITGGFTEIVRAWPGAIRSLHPTHSVAAIGDDAAEFCRDHEQVGAVSLGSPLVKLAEMGGWILLVGVGHNRNTTIHCGEVLAPTIYIDDLRKRGEVRTAILRIEGREQILPLIDPPGCSVGFGAIEGPLRKRGAIRDGELGDAHVQLMRSTDVIDTTMEMLREDPESLLCTDPQPHRCTVTRALIAASR